MSVPLTDTDEVLSGEGVAIDVQPIGFLMRTLGAIIDVLVSVALFALFLIIRFWVFEGTVLGEATDRILAVVAMVVCFLIVPVTLEVALRGRSLGRLAIGGRIVRIDGGATGFRHAFIRGLLGVLEVYMSIGAVAVLSGLLTARSQRLGDLVAGTYCQRVRMPHLQSHTPVIAPQLAGWATIADVARLPDRLARRVSQFLQNAERMTPAARVRVAAELLSEASAFISPLPPGPPEQVLSAMTVLRRERERRALAIADQRAETLTGRRLSA